jgi:serine-type D-Ala-D-Ala carboxypeptidase/endopeptidase (penicillin-binding protein 4)
MFVRRTRITALATLTLANVFTLAAGLVVAHMLPPRLARLHVARTAAGPVIKATPVLAPAGTGTGRAGTAPMPTATGLLSMLAAALPTAETGGNVGIEVADEAYGQVLYSASAATAATPASTTKVLTAVAALATLGPDARFSTVVRQARDGIVLVGGGDPTLAVDGYPSSDYPRPAALAQLAASTAKALKSQGRRSVRLGYDTTLYTGSGMAPGWTDGLVATGNVTPVVSLEVDQGRLTAGGSPQDEDDPVNFRPRTEDPAGMAAGAFAARLEKNGITVTGTPQQTTAAASAPVLARVSSPPLVQIVEQMLLESNNVIAENLARHVAIALGMPATFSGAAAAEVRELRRLGITAPVSLVDGSGLSAQDGIAPQTLVRAIALAARTPKLSGVITGLPAAGFNGTLSKGGSVFGKIGGIAGGTARGVVRAKTGNLATVATLAGLAYDKDGRLLLFAIMAPQVPTALQLQQAADDIDAAAAGLAACGCR